MKLGLVTELDIRNTTTSKNIAMTPCQEVVTLLSLYQLIPNLDQSESRILEAWSVKPTCLSTVTFCITKTENRTKKSLTQL